VRGELRRLEQEEIVVREQSIIVDPDNPREAGFASIQRGESIELTGDAELKEFFDDIVSRGKKRVAETTKAEGGCDNK
jgi:hypothetical protein